MRPFDTVAEYERFHATHYAGQCDPDCQWCREDEAWEAEQAARAEEQRVVEGQVEMGL